MSDVNVIIDSAPASISIEAAPISIYPESEAGGNVEIKTIPIDVIIEAAPIVVEIGGAQGRNGTIGVDGEAGQDVMDTWVGLALSWTEEPEINATIPISGGEVYDYTFGATTFYRHVPSPYVSNNDTFYQTYSSGVLSTPLASRGNVIP